MRYNRRLFSMICPINSVETIAAVHLIGNARLWRVRYLKWPKTQLWINLHRYLLWVFSLSHFGTKSSVAETKRQSIGNGLLSSSIAHHRHCTNQLSNQRAYSWTMNGRFVAYFSSVFTVQKTLAQPNRKYIDSKQSFSTESVFAIWFACKMQPLGNVVVRTFQSIYCQY